MALASLPYFVSTASIHNLVKLGSYAEAGQSR